MNNDVFKQGKSVFAGVSDLDAKKALLASIEEVMVGKVGELLHPKQKEKFSTDIQNQILLETAEQGDVYFVCSLIDTLADFWPDDVLSLFEKIDSQKCQRLIIDKVNLIKYRFKRG